jgi:lipoprotein-anchoring transpeptidase ErfK/SrfK
MLERIPVIAALAGLALTGALSACGSAAQPSAAQPSAAQSSAAQHSAAAGASASIPPSKATPAQPSSPSRSSSPAPVPRAPVIFAVRLGNRFQPGTLRISPGQHFVVTVDSSVKASGPGVPSSCPGTTARIDGGMLTVRCTSGAFYYTAERPGTAELMATVRPRCARGSMCPQWIAEATLKITIV